MDFSDRSLLVLGFKNSSVLVSQWYFCYNNNHNWYDDAGLLMNFNEKKIIFKLLDKNVIAT